MPEAIRLVLMHAFLTMRLHRISSARHVPRRIGSLEFLRVIIDTAAEA